jgi:hypothetical protein
MNYIRFKRIIAEVNEKGERISNDNASYASINEAKRQSRLLQQQGNKLRLVSKLPPVQEHERVSI